jgi:hypothetical protein
MAKDLDETTVCAVEVEHADSHGMGMKEIYPQSYSLTLAQIITTNPNPNPNPDPNHKAWKQPSLLKHPNHRFL